MTSIDVIVVGGGPAGLTAAAGLARRGLEVAVLERDEAMGGVPRHSDHPGYGLRDLRRSLPGPAYAALLANRAADAGALLLPGSTVTGLGAGTDAGGALGAGGPVGSSGSAAVTCAGAPGTTVEVTSPAGRQVLTAGALVLATGCRERPRAARLVPGTRPAGVLTTGWLQRLVHLEHQPPGRAAVVIGAEHVSYSAILTLAEAGCRTVALVTPEARPTTYAAFALAARARWSVPVLTGCEVVEVLGQGRVSGVRVRRATDRRETVLPCDTVVFSGDWVAEQELARRIDAAIDPATGGPLVDAGLRTSVPGVFAAGNLLHPAATADVCALDGEHVADAVAAWLRGSGRAAGAAWPQATGHGLVRVEVDPPLLWAVPGRLGPTGPPRDRLLLQTLERRVAPHVLVEQGGRTVWRGRVPWAVPTRPFPVPAAWRSRLDPDGGAVRIRLA